MNGRRWLVAVALLAAIASQALPAEGVDERSVSSKAPSGPSTWVASVRFEAQGVILEAGSHAQFVCSESMGKAGAPASMTAGSHASVMMALTPAEARELGEALIAWADTPTDSIIFTRTR